MHYHNITKEDMLNGDGLRVVLWVSGCSHKCKECHNPITWEERGGIPFDKAAKEEIFEELKKDYISGITLSGGDPLFYNNRAEVTGLVKEIKDAFPKKNIWMYTGFVWDEIKELEVMCYIDVIVDGKFEKELFDQKLHWRGSLNQNIIDVKESLKNQRMVLYQC